MATYTVKKGDCLWNIAKSQLGNPYRWTEIADLNKISRSNPIIYPNQVLTLPDSGGGTTPPANTTPRPIIQYFGPLAGSTHELIATWSWDKAHTKNYRVMWYYKVGGIWIVGNDSETKDGSNDYKNSVYSAPENATHIRFKVFPNSEQYDKKNKNETVKVNYFTGSWSTEKIYDCSNFPPKAPPTPTVNIEGYKLTASIDNIPTDLNADSVIFEIVKNNQSPAFHTSRPIPINKAINYVSYAYNVTAGGDYKVRCRSCKGSSKSDWSTYSSNVGTIPAVPSAITVCKANSETSAYLEWTAVANAESYDIQYTTKINYFDTSDETDDITGIEFTKYEKTGLDTGNEYFFRVRAVNKAGHSGWSGIKSTVLGKKPAAPTTWSSTTTAVSGDPLTLYWVHNSGDGSSQTFADLEVYLDGVKQPIPPIENTKNEDEKDKTSSYAIDTSEFVEGMHIEWRVRTAGITLQYGDWSVERTIDIYAPPTLEMSVIDASSNPVDILESFPFYVSALAGPKTQAPIGYHLAIKSTEIYDTVDNMGNPKTVKDGEEVYSKYFDTGDPLMVELSANNVDLENNITYDVVCTVSMNSGLTAEAMATFKVAWTDAEYIPNAEIGIDESTYSAILRPYCKDENNELLGNILLSVYRREFDGSFTEIGKDLDNLQNTFVVDPHPALDYARYRLIAKTKSTGAISYYDMPGYPVDGKAVIIQWDEHWSNFLSYTEDSLAEPPWSGSLLKLLYNIDVSDSHSMDVALVKYIGRKNPVTYYGTQLGQTSSWSMKIEKSDEETLYALRRLAIWTGDVYVREPSGSGYWANINVSFSQTHCELTIPVTLNITRVEGGV